MAVATGNFKKIMLLLKAGGDLNVRDKDGDTPFHFAVDYFDSEIVSRLLDAGADPRVRDGYDRTPLHGAARANADSDVIALLVASGADPVSRRGPLTPL